MNDNESRIFRIEPTGSIVGVNSSKAVGSEDVVPISREGDLEKVNDLEEFPSKRMEAKYPADCYSFLSLHTPFEQPKFFAFGIMVWMFQVRFVG